MVGPDTSKPTVSWHTHASPLSAPAIMLSSRSRTGSASALNTRANAAACACDSAVPVTGVQHSTGSTFAVGAPCLDTRLS